VAREGGRRRLCVLDVIFFLQKGTLRITDQTSNEDVITKPGAKS
jgi:hypothetical protein